MTPSPQKEARRDHTPPRSPAQSDPGSIVDRLATAEIKLAALTSGKSGFTTPQRNLEDVMERQCIMLERLNAEKRPAPGQLRSTIRVEPRVSWPRLGDDGLGGKEVEEFYERLEEIFGLANNGQGMSAPEKLVAMKGCLHGSRRAIYENIFKKCKGSDGLIEDADAVYKLIKLRLLRFCETAMGKQLRIRRDWDSLSKGRNMNALQFEAKWEELLADLEECGLGKTELDKFLAYVEKMGPQVGEEIRKDRRPRLDGTGGLTTRAPKSWEEAHEVLVELENPRAGTKAQASNRAGGIEGYTSTPPWQKTKEKGEGKGICYRFRDNGKCDRPDCPYEHQKGGKGKGKGKGKGYGKSKIGAQEEKDSESWWQDAGAQKTPDQILCKYIRKPSNGTCPDGKHCKYSHDPKKGKGKGKSKGKGKGKAGKQETTGDTTGGWEKPIGLKASPSIVGLVGATCPVRFEVAPIAQTI